MRIVDLTQKRFERLLVLSRIPDVKPVRWKCLCDCGSICEVRGGHLTQGLIRSCGCYSRELFLKRSSTHSKSKTKVYDAWLKIRSRCEKTSNKSYDRYGGRGITVCDRWRDSFEAFYKDMGEPPTSKHSIERIDNDGNYEPGNCRWATNQEQARNRRTSRKITFEGETKTIAEWAEQTGLHQSVIWSRLDRGWSVEDSLAKPSKATQLRGGDETLQFGLQELPQ